MDPLSATASIVAIVTLAAQTTAALSKLRETCQTLPGRLIAVHNEVADLEAVVGEVGQLSPAFASADRINRLLTHSAVKLIELKGFAEQLEKACSQTSIPLVKGRSWQKAQGKLQRLQEDLQPVKADLNILLSSSDSYAPIRLTH